jgi:hypothetical protein
MRSLLKKIFVNSYANLGYRDAIATDQHSLSYVALPRSDLCIIAIDASKYEDYEPEGDVAAGRIKPETIIWILDQLAAAKQQNIMVFAMMHHNLIEHYQGQSQFDPGYVIDNWQCVANTLIEAGLKIIFTGHYYANDISTYSHNGKQLYDIQKGSLVTAPSPYRLVTVKDQKLEITTRNILSIESSLPGNANFPAYSSTFLSQNLDAYFNRSLSSRFGVPKELTTLASPLFRNGIMAHFRGDESTLPTEDKKIEELRSKSATLANILKILWSDTRSERQ